MIYTHICFSRKTWGVKQGLA